MTTPPPPPWDPSPDWTPKFLGPFPPWWVGVEGYPRSKVTYRGVFGVNGSKSVVGFGVALYGAIVEYPTRTQIVILKNP